MSLWSAGMTLLVPVLPAVTVEGSSPAEWWPVGPCSR